MNCRTLRSPRTRPRRSWSRKSTSHALSHAIADAVAGGTVKADARGVEAVNAGGETAGAAAGESAAVVANGNGLLRSAAATSGERARKPSDRVRKTKQPPTRKLSRHQTRWPNALDTPTYKCSFKTH